MEGENIGDWGYGNKNAMDCLCELTTKEQLEIGDGVSNKWGINLNSNLGKWGGTSLK
jgi:hypothetical protein